MVTKHTAAPDSINFARSMTQKFPVAKKKKEEPMISLSVLITSLRFILAKWEEIVIPITLPTEIEQVIKAIFLRASEELQFLLFSFEIESKKMLTWTIEEEAKVLVMNRHVKNE